MIASETARMCDGTIVWSMANNGPYVVYTPIIDSASNPKATYALDDK